MFSPERLLAGHYFRMGQGLFRCLFRAFLASGESSEKRGESQEFLGLEYFSA